MERNKESSQVRQLLTQDEGRIPPIQQLRNRSQIILSDDTNFKRSQDPYKNSQKLPPLVESRRQNGVSRPFASTLTQQALANHSQSTLDNQRIPVGPQKVSSHPSGFYSNNRLNSKAVMHDFRPEKKKKQGNDFLSHKMVSSSRQLRLDQAATNPLRQNQSHPVLEPILEDEHAQAVHLNQIRFPKALKGTKSITSSRRSIVTEYSDPDNGITFLDNFDRILNPQNQKTPPPPMWGEVLEEDLYDDSQPFYDDDEAMTEFYQRKRKLAELRSKYPPKSSQSGAVDGALPSRKLKRKVIYVYEKENTS
mmetsp:Transcript_8880/g.15071  ORF Transcript_8880/g.15071 Transcript_8880/m.15071 type:complete len:307 (+) Transcript_8880:141-1061(+)|eukprot:CAMPEP_0168615304 /NCGR_PEP_ID=MMETSP0449_2-20121227/4434_1 /TAXON_ID=1082188 /ORGANISM="Strombidium rassoulzadegani, Strain ras09" /LENGTH=306 /DNA_ID=CAMNT_0008656037 /DNA_START=35 /DNA_END=955 /DNA_ORIENTATION=-